MGGTRKAEHAHTHTHNTHLHINYICHICHCIRSNDKKQSGWNFGCSIEDKQAKRRCVFDTFVTRAET